MSPSRLDDGHESPSLPASVSSDSDGFDSSRTRTAIHKAGSSDGPAKRYAFVDRWTHHRWVSWIKPRLTWPHLRPVVRSAVAVRDDRLIMGRSRAEFCQAWIGLLLQLIHPTERALGQAACECEESDPLIIDSLRFGRCFHDTTLPARRTEYRGLLEPILFQRPGVGMGACLKYHSD